MKLNISAPQALGGVGICNFVFAPIVLEVNTCATRKPGFDNFNTDDPPVGLPLSLSQADERNHASDLEPRGD